MSTSIDQAFIKQYESEVFAAYQRMGSKLRNTIRTKTGVVGASTVFQKVGKGTASTKTRHGDVPVMNLDHSNVEATLQDHYAGDWVDKLDELKTNIDERQVLTNAGAYALGRKTDEIIITELDKVTGAQVIPVNTSGLTMAKIEAGLVRLGNEDVPDDGDRFAFVGWRQWADLLKIDEFKNSNFIGEDDLPFKGGGSQGKRWLGTMWMPHSGLPLNGANRSIFWYHKSSVGHAIGQDVTSDISWHGDKASHFVNNMMSQGAALIEALGVVKIICAE